ncbi:MAG: ATP-binding protein [Clostridiales bacterium]|nr:ATP-binding protein [Clostridiales bacterium]
MSEVFLREILQEYDAIQREESRSLHQRRQEIFNKIPELAKIDRDMVELMARQSREIILNPNDSSTVIDQLQKEIAQLKTRKIELLDENGYPRDYLEMRYRCSQCEDTGYVGYPIKEKCGCLIQRLLEKSYQLSNIQDLDFENFSTFDPMVFSDELLENSKLSQRQYMVQLRDRLIDYVSKFPDNHRKTILFTGKTGLGKTFLLNCMAKSIMDQGYTVIRISAYKLFDQLFYSSISDKNNYEGLQRQLFEVDALIIDDLGTETRRNNYTSEDLFNIINERTLQRSHTFLSTNLSLSDLRQRYSDRITSRLFDVSNTMLVRFRGSDIRLRQK